MDTDSHIIPAGGEATHTHANTGSQVAERLGNGASYQNVAGSIPGRAKGGNVPVLTVSRFG